LKGAVHIHRHLKRRKIKAASVTEGEEQGEQEEGEGAAGPAEGLYEVAHIVGKRMAGREEYRVRWLGYAAADDTWEPGRNR
jgi:hypothetical protein